MDFAYMQRSIVRAGVTEGAQKQKTPRSEAWRGFGGRAGNRQDLEVVPLTGIEPVSSA